MSYESFQTVVNAMVKKAGGDIPVKFMESDGKYIAKFCDGTFMTGNSISKKISVRWNGRNHQSMVSIA